MPAQIFESPNELFGFTREKLVCTSGGFDPIHIGHLHCIQETVKIAKQEGLKVCVIVNGDGFLIRKKGKPFMTHAERMEIIAAIEGVDYVVGWDDGTQTVTECLNILRPVKFTKGGDRSSPEAVPEFPLCQSIGCEIIFGVGGTSKIQSSSNLIKGLGDHDSYDLLFESTADANERRNKKTIDKPWGSEYLIECNDKYAAKILTILPHARLSLQYHEQKDETIYVMEGTLHLILGQGNDSHSIFLQKGDSYHIVPGEIHRFEAWHNTVKLFEVSTPELDDVVRLADDYGRLSVNKTD